RARFEYPKFRVVPVRHKRIMLVSSPDQFMKQLPQRLSLVAQTAGILREQITAGTWEHLPGERELCARLRVSRPTLRLALEALRKEGLFHVAQGKRRQIRQPG